MSIFYSNQLNNGLFTLDADEARHCIKVLRKKEGDEIAIIDGAGNYYTALITDTTKTEVIAKVLKQEIYLKYHNDHAIAIAPTKNADRIEWFVEKSVELGIGHIYLFKSKRAEFTNVKMERLHKIVISAMKQSKNIYAPKLHGIITMNEVINLDFDNKYIAYCEEKPALHLKSNAPFDKSCLLLIGPEGDFTATEVANAQKIGFKPVSLGEARLRTETAALFGLSVMNLF